MGDIMNTKGFTLTELIVTIALIGIISMIAFPAISKLREDNENEKYKTYEKVMKNGAMLYMDTYKKDLFKSSNQKVKIKYSDLNGLIEAYSDKNVDCSSSYVCATNTNSNVIKYEPVVICTSNSKTLYNTNDELSKAGKSKINC